MVALPIFLKVRSFAAIASAALAIFTATPASANASANADILAPIAVDAVLKVPRLHPFINLDH